MLHQAGLSTENTFFEWSPATDILSDLFDPWHCDILFGIHFLHSGIVSGLYLTYILAFYPPVLWHSYEKHWKEGKSSTNGPFFTAVKIWHSIWTFLRHNSGWARPASDHVSVDIIPRTTWLSGRYVSISWRIISNKKQLWHGPLPVIRLVNMTKWKYLWFFGIPIIPNTIVAHPIEVQLRRYVSIYCL